MIDADDDDYESWSGSALRYAELVAHQIARFKNPWWNPTWHDLIPDDSPPPPPSPPRAFAFGWGLRGKRSRPAARIGVAKRDVAAAAAYSPGTPLDFGSGCGSGFGSGASTSGGEEGVSPLEKAATAAAVARKRSRKVGDDADVSVAGGGCETEAVRNGSPPSGFKISAAAKDIRRTGKKKTLGELQEEEKVLLEEKNMLQKEVEMGRKAYEALKAENHKLKCQQLHMQSQKTPIDAVVTSASPSSDTHFLLPDLNEPLSEN